MDKSRGSIDGAPAGAVVAMRGAAIRRPIALALDAFGRDLEDPGQHEGEGKAERQHDRQQPQGSFRRIDDAEQHVGHLQQQPRARSVEQGYTNDVASLQLSEERWHAVIPYLFANGASVKDAIKGTGGTSVLTNKPYKIARTGR